MHSSRYYCCKRIYLDVWYLLWDLITLFYSLYLQWKKYISDDFMCRKDVIVF